MSLELAAAFVAGLLTFVAPCTLPVLPLVVGAGAVGGRRRPLGVVVGFGGSFVIMSVLLASLLGASGLAAAQLRVASAVVLALVGVALAVPRLERPLEAALVPAGRAAPASPRDPAASPTGS
jgi:cytochrome c biogenesis protein CcdA